jgi:hypothetical protein
MGLFSSGRRDVAVLGRVGARDAGPAPWTAAPADEDEENRILMCEDDD